MRMSVSATTTTLLVSALSLGFLSSPVHADDTALTAAQEDALSARMAACDKLPNSKQHGCIDRARKDYTNMDPSLTPAQKAALEREDARYTAAVAACKKQPVSRRDTCIDAAGRDHRLAGIE